MLRSIKTLNRARCFWNAGIMSKRTKSSYVHPSSIDSYIQEAKGLLSSDVSEINIMKVAMLLLVKDKDFIKEKELLVKDKEKEKELLVKDKEKEKELLVKDKEKELLLKDKDFTKEKELLLKDSTIKENYFLKKISILSQRYHHYTLTTYDLFTNTTYY